MATLEGDGGFRQAQTPCCVVFGWLLCSTFVAALFNATVTL
jgi:hypothetical protein